MAAWGRPRRISVPERHGIDSFGNIIVTDSARFLIYYSPEGLFQKKVTLKASLSLPSLGPEGLSSCGRPQAPGLREAQKIGYSNWDRTERSRGLWPNILPAEWYRTW
ncbi:MAG: hypothetical protein MZV64_52765 [Ignavibacteriales bacterium]|nr:hypothetical protein [Ignavibacteriales bacterium]